MLLLLVSWGGSLVAAPSREDRAFAAGAAAFQDGIYDRAETALTNFVARYRTSDKVPEAVLLAAQAQYQQGKFTAAINSLTAPHQSPGTLADRYVYWLGEALFAQGNFERAAETFTALPENFPDSPLRLTAVVEAAAAYGRGGDWQQLTTLLTATNGVFVPAAELDATNELVARGWLLLAQAQLAQEDFPGALATLKRLNGRTLAPDLDWQRANLLCRVEAGAGDLAAALATTTNLLELARAQKDTGRLADSVAWRGTVLERLGRGEEAAAVWSENLTNNAPMEWQRESILKIAAAAVAQTNFVVAEATLQRFLAQFASSPAADLARLTLGELQLKDFVADASVVGQLAQAQSNFDRLLAGSTNGPLAGKAFLDRGWCFWLAGRVPESLADFNAAAVRLPFSEDLAVAKFKAGDARFALKDFLGARSDYAAVMKQFGNVPDVTKSLGARVLYQILRANLELKDAAGADAAMREMLEKFPTSDLADNSLLLLAEANSDWGLTTNAFKAFQDFTRLFPDSALAPQVELAKARAFERVQNWPAAITNYEGWLKSFPTNAQRPQVAYALGRANFQAGNETGAFTQFTNFVAQFPADTNAPLAQWWVADYYFRSGTNYAAAEKNYELIFQNPAWTGSALYYPAQLMAGRSAAGRLGFADAVKYFTDAANAVTQLMGETNHSPGLESLRNQALFGYGGVLKRMDAPDTNHPFANFEAATNVFALLYQTNATSELGALANSELADCYLQLGAFDAATNTYALVISSRYAGADLRSRAKVGLGIVLEKKAELAEGDARLALWKQAFDQYLDVLDMDRGKELTNRFWAKKAGLLALALAPKTGVSNPDQFIDDLERLFPTLKEVLEKKRAALKN